VNVRTLELHPRVHQVGFDRILKSNLKQNGFDIQKVVLYITSLKLRLAIDKQVGVTGFL
jgi:hypothetical protein